MTRCEIARQIEELESYFCEHRTTHGNPCGGSVYYDEDSGIPYRVHFADGAQDECFRSFGEARKSIEAYVQDRRKEAD